MNESTPRIYTRTGDDGSTGLIKSDRVHKDNLRIQAIGDIDEFNCQLGATRCVCADDQMRVLLKEIQNLLFELGAELAQPMSVKIYSGHATRVEEFINKLSLELPPLKSFILPGGNQGAAQCHLARAVCRRAERSMFRLARTDQVNSASLKFINRLSDLLFVIARTLNHRAGEAETPWKPFVGAQKK